MMKRILIMILVVGGLLGIVMLFTYNVIKIDRISFMEIQPAFRPMEDPLPVPQRSIPVEGAAFIPGMGAPVNPIETDEISVERGGLLFGVNCAICHGVEGGGNGSVAPFLSKKKPADLTSEVVQVKSDGAIFLVISNGVPGTMPALNENLTVRDRWDVVNYIRTLAP
jgi:mono/diheme cytochrome c family protein